MDTPFGLNFSWLSAVVFFIRLLLHVVLATVFSRFNAVFFSEFCSAVVLISIFVWILRCFTSFIHCYSTLQLFMQSYLHINSIVNRFIFIHRFNGILHIFYYRYNNFLSNFQFNAVSCVKYLNIIYMLSLCHTIRIIPCIYDLVTVT